MSSDSVDEPPLKFSRGVKSSITNEKEIQEDRISSLPDCLLIHILSFLGHTKEVVRTCVLSKRWEYVWTNLLEVDLREYSHNNKKRSKFLDFVGRIVAMCKNLNKIAVDFLYEKRFASHVKFLFYLAINNKVKDITFKSCSESYELPQMFYSNSSLTNLKLRGSVMAPRGIISWGSLKTLSIDCSATDCLMEKILSGCPVLEVLRLRSVQYLDSLNISSPNLTTLGIKECSICENDSNLDISAPHLRVLSIYTNNSKVKFRLRNVQSVVQAKLDFNGICCESEKGYMKELLEKLQSIEKLELGPRCVEIVTFMLYKDGLEFDLEELPLFTKLQCLTLNGNSIPAIVGMMWHSSNLETLHIRKSWTDSNNLITMEKNINEESINDEDFDETNDKPLSMKTVQITDFTEQDLTTGHMLFFIKLLLMSTPALKDMIITVKEDSGHKYAASSTSVDSSKLAKKLLTFSRASRKAVVVLN